ncbi:MAG TPA: hypothetical protein VMJ34_16495 [Bryobacteraceae bacterium]|nr:hypothetical protein [Bryobacteraceae bacterium]HTQ87160.1 hypothetical protein [Candidatus Solibacter sp.]
MKTLFRCSVLALALAGMSFAQINHRRVNQQARIAQGVRSGSLTPRETAHLEHQEAHINREVRRDRAMNGGHLTPRERARVNGQLNRESNRIYRRKHN